MSHSRVLVGCLDPALREAFNEDSQVYLRHYPHVDVASFSSTGTFLDAVKKGYDVVHLFFPVASGGLRGSDLIDACCERDVKLLWIANENRADDYVKGFRAAGKPLNLVMTLNRNGAKFCDFLENLLSRVAVGETLPLAWAALVPQAEGPWQQNVPSCIFFAGRAEVKLLP